MSIPPWLSISTPALKHPAHLTENRKFVDKTGLSRQPYVIRISRLPSQVSDVDVETVPNDKVPDFTREMSGCNAQQHTDYPDILWFSFSICRQKPAQYLKLALGGLFPHTFQFITHYPYHSMLHSELLLRH